MLRRSQEEIEYAFETFAAGCDIIVKGYTREKFPTLPLEGVSIVPGRVYWKLVLENKNDYGGYSRTVYGFVRRKDGAIFKAATYRRPQTETKTAIRGYITDESPMEYFTPHGVIYAM